MTKLLAPREPMKPVLVFDPDVPENVRYADTPRKLAVLYAQGFKKVKPQRLGQVLAKTRKKLGLDVYGMAVVLEQRGVKLTPYTLDQLEDGVAPADFTVHFVKTLAAALGVTVAELVYKSRRLTNGVKPADVRHITELTPWTAKGSVMGNFQSLEFEAVVLAHDEDEAKERIKAHAKKAGFNMKAFSVNEITRRKMKPDCVYFIARGKECCT